MMMNTEHHPSTPQTLAQKSNWQQFKPVISVVGFIAGVVVSAMAINAFIFQSYFVQGSSMVPTLHNNDRLIIDKIGHTFATIQGKAYIPNRGDIIVIDSNLVDATGQPEQLIKRVVALPGERITVENGVVTVFNNEFKNGKKVDDILGLTIDKVYPAEKIDTKVGSDEIFVMGDNRNPGGSLDSRVFGPVKASAIEGKLWARVLPFNSVRTF